MERALKESEAKTRSILDNIDIGVALISPEMEILELNHRMGEWFPGVDPARRPICYRAFNSPPREMRCEYCPTCKIKLGTLPEIKF
jgi:PAS domain-containing protein